MSRSSVPAAPPAASGYGQAASRRPYTPLFRRVAAINAVVLVGACVVTILVLSPGKLHSFAASEAIVLAGALALVVVINLFLLRRALGPLEALTALARRVDLTRPGQRVPVGPYRSEVSELGTTFNEMLARLESERRDATRRVLAAQEDERLRIAQELHDEVGQTLTAVLLQLGRSARPAQPELGGELLEIQETARASLEDVRRISRELAQEALTNIARHAGTDRAELSLASSNGRLTLRVLDAGSGIDPRRADGGGL